MALFKREANMSFTQKYPELYHSSFCRILRAVRNWYKNIVRFLTWKFRLPLLIIVRRNYIRKLKKMQKQEKIKVAFIVSDNRKWKGVSLYKKLLFDQRFTPLVLVTVLQNTNYQNDANYIFFKQRNYNVFAIANLADLRKYKPDIVFCQQPTGLMDDFSPFRLSKYALCFYFPYGIAANINSSRIWNIRKLFFLMLYKQFLFSLDCVRLFEERGMFNVIATGSPQLDVYSEPVKNNPWRYQEKMKIIYAPHHSFSKLRSQFATFAWNGKQILQMAKNDPCTEWIFKPHPLFPITAIQEKIMTKQEVDEYFTEWAQIGQVYDKGDYIDLFRTSDLMITDSDGFLTEYLPTGNPVIYLISPNSAVRSHVSQKSSRHYYKVHNLTELEQVFDMLVKERKDPLKAERQKDAEEIIYNSADKIYNELLKILGEKK